MKKLSHYYQGSSLLEGMLAILIFSIGLISILNLLTTSLTEVGNARYRSEASMLAGSVITEMWTGDRSLAKLKQRYGSKNAEEYTRWRAIVAAKLPGITETINTPEISVSDTRRVTINIRWRTPAEKNVHKLTTVTVITD